MEIILNNPFRILGLYSGAKATLLNRNFNRLKIYADADQEIPDELSLAVFPCLGPCKRTKDSIENASAHLNLDKDKMLAALFWFYEGNQITDEPAFDEFREGKINGASEIWKKLVEKGDVSERNFSAFQNLSTLYLQRAFSGAISDSGLLNIGIGLKIQFLESDYALKFQAVVTDTTYKTSKSDLQLYFLQEVEKEIQKSKRFTEDDLIGILANINFIAKAEFNKKYVQKPIEQIEKKIEETKKSQKSNPEIAGEYGFELYNFTKPLLGKLISVLGKSDIKIGSISDKVANEILSCSITLFNHFHESDTEVGEIALELNILAKSIARGSLSKDKIGDSTSIVERYVKERPLRQKIKKVKVELDYISKRIEFLQSQDDTLSNVKSFLDACSNKLEMIMYNLGHDDQIYLNISSGVVLNAQGMLIRSINQSQSQIRYKQDLVNFRYLLTEAIKVTNTIGLFHMEDELRYQYQENRKTLIQIEQNVFSKTASSFEKIGRSLGKVFN